MEGFKLLLADISELLHSIRPQQLGGLLFFCLWLVLLCAPLKNTDRRDSIAHATYAVVVSAFGVYFVLILPFGSSMNLSPAGQLIATLSMILAGGVRWLVVIGKTKILSEFKG